MLNAETVGHALFIAALDWLERQKGLLLLQLLLQFLLLQLLRRSVHIKKSGGLLFRGLKDLQVEWQYLVHVVVLALSQLLQDESEHKRVSRVLGFSIDLGT